MATSEAVKNVVVDGIVVDVSTEIQLKVWNEEYESR